MSCLYPINAYKGLGAKITFNPRENIGGSIGLPCGRCIACRLEKNQHWATRCMHEAQMHEASSFITLTFSEEHYKPGLDITDFQAFIKRLRRFAPNKIRYFAAGEYGDLTKRPHWHALIFGHAFDRQGLVSKNAYYSSQLAYLWREGTSSTGDITRESAAYTASYVIKKQTGDLHSDYRYSRVDLRTGEIFKVTPELALMSRRPGIGHDWIKKHWKEVYLARDAVVDRGGKANKPPRYYNKQLEQINLEQLEKRKEDRRRKRSLIHENAQSRLSRETNIRARIKLKGQTLR